MELETLIKTAVLEINSLDEEMTEEYENLSKKATLSSREYLRGKINGVRSCARTLGVLINAYNQDLKKGG